MVTLTFTIPKALLYEEDRLSFAAYRARKGEPLDDANTHWPLRPAA